MVPWLLLAVALPSSPVCCLPPAPSVGVDRAAASVSLDGGRPAELQPPQIADEWIAPDKAQHFVGSFMIYTVTYAALRTADVERRPARTASVATTLAIGVSKELFDLSRGGPFSWKDIVWDVAGTAVAHGAFWVLDR